MNDYNQRQQGHFRKEGKSAWIGIIFIVVGGLLLARMAGFYLFDWLFQWEFILIAIGLIIGVKEGFRNLTWLVLVGLGTFFLLDDIFPDFNIRRMILPAIFIGIGLVILFGRTLGRKSTFTPLDSGIPNDPLRTSADQPDPIQPSEGQVTAIVDGLGSDASTETVLNVASIFGAVKKNVLSRNFRGGDVVSIFGGTEINLLHADGPDPIVLECVSIFGGTKLFIPNTWEIKSEVAAIFGGIEDKRTFPQIRQVPNKTIILKGFSMFGGVEIKSY